MKYFLAACLFAACMIAAPIFTEAIAAPVDVQYVTPDVTLPAEPVGEIKVRPVRFCAVTNRTPRTHALEQVASITSDRYHIRC